MPLLNNRTVFLCLSLLPTAILVVNCVTVPLLYSRV